MKAILYILEHDFRRFFRYRWWIAGLIAMNLADLFVMAVVFTNMVRTDVLYDIPYFSFFAPGITITALFAAAFMIGREVNMEVRRKLSDYMLSLPITRLELAAGRMLSGGLRGMVYMSPLLLINFFFLGFPTPLQLLAILGALLLISTGTSGLSISIAVATKSFEKFVTMRGVLYYMLFFCSTVFYPMSLIQGILPLPLVWFAQLNPLSCGADLIRAYLIGSPTFTMDLIRNLAIFSAIFTLVGAVVYIKIIESQ
jgi:ABC-2 type transport system permease protein